TVLSTSRFLVSKKRLQDHLSHVSKADIIVSIFTLWFNDTVNGVGLGICHLFRIEYVLPFL
ncbi:MAG: hypothetical protein V4700_05635, partial [Pseudomonadota bacterium]